LLYHTYVGDGDPDAKWSFNDISYSFTNALDGGLQGVSASQIRQIVAEAFAVWAAVSPLKFTEQVDPNPSLVTDDTYDGSGLPTIRIGQHNIDGGNGTLAHAIRPGDDGRNGDLHFDISESWTFASSAGGSGSGSPYNMLEVAAHEIGHTIGLDHESVNPALMVPNYANRFGGSGTGFLESDDILGIQSLYGSGLGYVLDRFGTMWVAGTSAIDTLSLGYNSVNNTINVVSNGWGNFNRSTSGINKIIFLGSGGSDIFNIARTPFPVEVDGGAGSDLLNLFGYDSTNSYTLNGNTLTGHSVGTYNNVESLGVWGGAAGDFFTVNAAPTIPVTFHGQGAGDDVHLNVLSTNVTVFGDAGNDTIEVNEPTAPVSAPTIMLDAGDDNDLFRVTRLDRGLVLNCGNGDDSVDVARGGAANAVFGAITINGDAGNDSVYLAPAVGNVTGVVNAPVTFNGAGGDDVLTIGSGRINAVSNKPTFNAGTGSVAGDSVVLNNTLDTGNFNWLLTPTTVHRGALDDVTFNGIASLTLNCGSGKDSVEVPPSLTYQVTINANDGDDNFVVGGGTLNFDAGAQTFNGGNGTDAITYDDHLDTIGRIWEIHPTEIIVQLNFSRLHLGNAGFEAMGLLAGTGDDTVQYYDEILKPVTVDAGPGNDTFNTGGCRARLLTCIAGTGNDTITVDDVGMPNGTIFQQVVTPTQIYRYDFVAEYYVNYDGFETVSYKLPAQANDVYVLGVSGFTTVTGNTSNDTFAVDPLDGAGNPTLTTGLAIDPGAGTDSVVVDDASSSQPLTYAFINLFGSTVIGSITFGAGPGGFSFYNTFEALTLNAGSGADTFNLASYKNGVPITINAGGGNDVVTYGNGNLANDMRAATFNFNGGTGIDTYYVLNAGSTGVHGYYVSPGTFSTIVPAGTTLVTSHTGFETISADAGSSGDNFQIFGTNPGEFVELNGEGGNDQYIFGSIFTVTLQTVLSPVRVNGGTGADLITLHNPDDNAARTYHVTQSRVGGNAGDNLFPTGAYVEFFAVTGSLTINNGNGADTIYAQPNATTPLVINGGNPTVAPGDVLNLALAGVSVTSSPAAGAISGTYTFSGRADLSFSGIETRNADAVAPQILSRSFNPTVGGQSISFTFDDNVSASLGLSSLTVSSVNSANLSYQYDSVTNTATWTFPGLGGTLPSGQFSASLFGAADNAGNVATGSTTWSFLWVNGTAAADTFRVTRSPNQTFLEVFRDADVNPTYQSKISTLNQFNLNAGGGDDTVTVDASRGGLPPVIASGAAPLFDGGDGAGDRFVLAGTSGSNTAVFSAGSATLDGSAYAHGNMASSGYQGNGGVDALTVNGGAVFLSAAADHFSNLSIGAGATAAMTPGGNKALVLDALAISTGGRLNVADNGLIFTNSTVAAVQSLLAGGFNGGAWNGATGIVSTTAAASTETSIGFASNASLNLTEFKGVTGLDGNDVLVKYTYAGDANLDGKVDIGDLGLLAGAWQQTSGKIWFDGDFTYDGKVDIGDLGLVAGNWQKGVGNPL
jgi:hypothetical protein